MKPEMNEWMNEVNFNSEIYVIIEAESVYALAWYIVLTE